MKRLLISIIVILYASSLFGQPTANFSQSSTATCVGVNVNFSNLSSADVTGWSWDFGDGSPTSTEINPSHAFSAPGSYSVTLTVENLSGATDDFVLTHIVRAPAASFSFNPSTGCSVPHTVFFTDHSISPDIWLWNFGDGSTSTAKNPIHSYTSGGIFPVKLTVTDTMYGCTHFFRDTVKISVPAADFTASNIFGCAPVTTNFTDASTGAVSWLWNFGDGETSNLQNPTYIYQKPGVYTVSLTITNAIGCSITKTRTNYVQAIGPDVYFGANQTHICPSSIVNFTDSTSFGAPVIQRIWNFGDGSPTSSLTDPSHTYINSGIYSVSLTVSDLDGCSRTFARNNYVDSRDSINPVISCPANITINTDAGLCTSTTSIGTATATDNCMASPSITNNAPTSFPIGNTTVLWTATDAAGNIDTCSQLVTVVDIENPVITCPANITINTDAGLCTSTTSIGTATAIDNCTVAVTNNAPVSFPIGNTTVLWTATDGSGNTDTCSQLVTVVDAENPVITCPANISINTDAGLCTSTATIGTATATDNCTASPIIANDAPASFPIGNTTVLWTVTDAAGNIDTCSQLVTVVDIENPVITCPANITINTDAGLCTSTTSIGTATAIDNCTVAVKNNAPVSFPMGNTTVLWTATDGSGNTDTCSQLVTVVDAENPVITCPANISINTDAGLCTSTATIGTATATDNCTASPIIANDAPANFPIGNTTVIWTATDAAGNMDTCLQRVTVVDSENPVIICPPGIIINTDAGLCTLTATIGTATATDNCTASPIFTNDAPANFPIGYTTVIWTATDAAGNIDTCSQLVTVMDAENPVITCPPDIIINTDARLCTSTATIGTATATDNCTASPIIANDAPANFPIGNTTVMWTATDAAGNIDTCSQLVTVMDAENPVITCPPDIIINSDAGLCTSTASIGTASATDNCTASPIIANDAPASFPIGNTTVLWSATDAAGNIHTCSQQVTVVDAENPIIFCPTDQIIIADNNCEIVIADYTSLASVTDNCDANPLVTQLPLAGSTLTGPGEKSITLTATDINGNMSLCTFLVTVSDTTAPVINCLENQVAALDANCEFLLPDYTEISIFSENCDKAQITTQTPAVGTLYTNKEILPVELVFQDAAGNTSFCSFMVEIFLNPNNPNCGSELIITTLFTPNGDGKNDTWIIRGLKGKCTVMVFDRGGQKVFESSAYNNDWDGIANGSLLPEGDYYYIINCEDGINYKGPLTLLRTK